MALIETTLVGVIVVVGVVVVNGVVVTMLVFTYHNIKGVQKITWF